MRVYVYVCVMCVSEKKVDGERHRGDKEVKR